MKVLFTIILLLFITNAYSQGVSAITTQDLVVQSKPNNKGVVYLTLLKDTRVFYLKKDRSLTTGYTKVMVIQTGLQGYVKSVYLHNEGDINKDRKSPFVEGQSEDPISQPELRIFNNTKFTMTLRLNGQIIKMIPHKRKNVEYQAGSCEYVAAAAANVRPCYGTHRFTRGHYYDWEFFIR